MGQEIHIGLKDFAGMKGYVAAKRAVFIVGRDSKISYKWVAEDPTVEPNYEEVRAALSGL